MRRNETEIEPGHASGGVVQHVEAVPGDCRLDRAHRNRGLGGKRQHRCAIGPRQRRLTQDQHRPLNAFEPFHEGMRAVGDLGERLGAGAEIIVGIGQVGILTDEPNGYFALSLTPALKDARIQHGRLMARIGADEKDRIGLVDAGDGGVEEIGRPSKRGIECRAILAAIDIRRAELLGEQLQREHLLRGGQIAGDGGKARAVEPFQPLGDDAKGLVPARRNELPLLSHIRPVETLGAQAVPDMARLVGDPFLVDGVVHARQDAHHLPPARIDADGAAERIHDVDRERLAELPGPRHEGVRLRGERADGTEIDDVPRQIGKHAPLEIGGDLHVLATADGAELLHARDLGHETHTARAVDAAIHEGADQRPEIFVLDRALVVLEAAGVEAVGHGLILQIAFAALVADRAVERMIDQQEFEHAFACFSHRL